METNNRSNESFNELVFENRHKDYGAYVIRKSYNDNVTIGLFLAIAFFGVLAVIPAIFNKNEPIVKKLVPEIIDSLISVPVVIIPDIIKEDLKKTTEKKIVRSDDLNYKATDEKVETAAKVNDQAVTVKDGDVKGTDSIPAKDIPNVVPATTTEDNKDYVSVDEMPEFYGNVYQFIKDRLQYPEIAKENRTQGVVGLSFVIEKDGSVDNIKNLNTVDDGCTEEAIRVLKLMPKWKPGKNHGQLVRVKYNIPVRFSLK